VGKKITPGATIEGIVQTTACSNAGLVLMGHSTLDDPIKTFNFIDFCTRGILGFRALRIVLFPNEKGSIAPARFEQKHGDRTGSVYMAGAILLAALGPVDGQLGGGLHLDRRPAAFAHPSRESIGTGSARKLFREDNKGANGGSQDVHWRATYGRRSRWLSHAIA